MGPKINKANSGKSISNVLTYPFRALNNITCAYSFCSMCKKKCKEYLDAKDYMLATRCLSQIHSIYLYQRLSDKHVRSLQKNKDNWTPLYESNEETSFNELNELLSRASIGDKSEFPVLPENYVKLLQNLMPENYSIVQLTCDIMKENCTTTKTRPGLFITQIKKQFSPFVCYIEPSTDDSFSSPMEEFSSIIASNESVHKNAKLLNDRKEYWEFREQLDLRMKGLLKTIQENWISEWKFLLTPFTIDHSGDKLRYVKLLQKHKINNAKSDLLLHLCECYEYYNEVEFKSMVSTLSGVTNSTTLKKICEILNGYRDSLVPESEKAHVILIVDKEFSLLPLESCDILEKHSVSRMPSIPVLCHYFQNWKEDKTLDLNSLYFLVNPGNDLPNVEVRMKAYIAEKKQWKGDFGTIPPVERIKNALASNDIYLYCGHGSGSKYLPSHVISNCKFDCTPILMGCNSASLRYYPFAESHGAPHTYLLAGCPCFVGMLYQVTDKECDRVTIGLMDELARDDGTTIPHAVAKARKSCKLFLTGAALVVYGLPMPVKKCS